MSLAIVSLIDPASLFVYSFVGVAVIVASWYAARRVRLWNGLRKLDRRQRVTPQMTVLTWAVTLFGFAPFVYYRVDTTLTLGVFGVGFFVGIQMLGVYASNRDWYRAHRETPKKEARMVGYEPVVVSGDVAVPDDELDVEPMEAPISGEPCVAYLSSINEQRWVPRSGSSGYRSTSATLALDEGGTPFYRITRRMPRGLTPWMKPTRSNTNY